jgi:hypothetical protein
MIGGTQGKRKLLSSEAERKCASAADEESDDHFLVVRQREVHHEASISLKLFFRIIGVL